MQSNEKLKLGILLRNEKLIPLWLHSMLEKIKKSNYADIKLIITQDKSILVDSQKPNSNCFLYDVYQKLDKWLFFNKCNALHLENAEKLLDGIPKLNLGKDGNKFYINDKTLNVLKNYDLDILFSVNYEKIDKKVLDIVKIGYWFYVFDNNYSDSKLDGCWSVLQQKSVTESNLCMMYKNENVAKLFSSYSATDSKSVIRNQNQLYWKGSSFLPRLLKQLCEKGSNEFFSSFMNNFAIEEQKKCEKLTNVYMVSKLFSIFKRYLSLKIKNIASFEQWVLLTAFDVGMPNSTTKFQLLAPPKDRFWADPMIVQKENLYYVFFEEFLYKTKKGHISLITMDEKVNSSPKAVLERTYHLSYPFIFNYKDDYYMIPESSANKTIELYKCTKFPDTWEFSKNLMEGVVAVDTTLFYKNGKWWMFTNMAENENSSTWDELFLFYSESPISDKWIPHPKNPIISDVRSARPAGKIFERDGQIYRPSQDNSNGYGSRLIINQIMILNETDYQEKQTQVIEPSQDIKLKAVHTLDSQNRLTIIDAKIQRKR